MSLSVGFSALQKQLYVNDINSSVAYNASASNTTNAKRLALTGGASAKWFDSETLVNNELGTGTTWATGDATSQTIDKNYYARQYKEGCYSESTVANVNQRWLLQLAIGQNAMVQVLYSSSIMNHQHWKNLLLTERTNHL